jgi:Ca-activated chloride channel homolog
MKSGRLIFAMLLFALKVACQKDAQLIYEGNKTYHSGKIPQSAAYYSKALEANPNNRKANFNLGNSLYKNGLLVKEGKMPLPPASAPKKDSLAGLIFDQAAQNFEIVANSISDKDTLHRAWHNIGNCRLQKKDYASAVEAYKKALKYDPKDEETRYNLAYALKHMPPEQKGGGGQNQDQKQKQEKQEQKQQQQQQQMNKEQAEQLLKALMESEKKLQDKRKQKAEDASKANQEKDW